MNILVLIAGIADPKWPLPTKPDPLSLQEHGHRYSVLSPFDEAALELALKLRDAHPSVRIEAVVGGSDMLARKVAGWRLDTVHRFNPAEGGAWNCRGFAASLASALGPLGREASVTLVGREFGDFDDGSVPPSIARALSVRYVALALAVEVREEALWVSHQHGAAVERLCLNEPALVSVTSDSHNRLRHPLLKNVMAARKLQFDVLPGMGVSADSGIVLRRIEPLVSARRANACQMLRGTPGEQAEALAKALIDARGTA
ncbi:MAG: hypothetical protein KJ011_06175 [Burkholderiaceae bacterium]|nr:hypothetical protein [Burkholderiaceae bacterium]